MACQVPANPDISGIGVRTAIYAQNLLSFIPAIWALKDNVVTDTELKAVEAQSVTILITAFAILISTIIQSQYLELSTFHAAIVLNLSWMNNTNAFIYFLLYVHHNSAQAGPFDLSWLWRMATFRGDLPYSDRTSNAGSPMSVQTVNKAERVLPWGILHIHRAVCSIASASRRSIARTFVFCLGSSHLTLMSSIGLWIWSNPHYFELRSTRFACSVDNAWIFVFFRRLYLSSEVLRWLSIAGYGLILVPWWNLVIPAAIFLTIQLAHHKFVASRSKTHLAHHHDNTARTRPEASRVPALIGLLILAGVNIIILASNEISIQGVRHIQDPGESDWTFGQVLSLLLLVLPLRDAIRFATEKNGNRCGRQLDSDSSRPLGQDNDTESGSFAKGREGSPSSADD